MNENSDEESYDARCDITKWMKPAGGLFMSRSHVFGAAHLKLNFFLHFQLVNVDSVAYSDKEHLAYACYTSTRQLFTMQLYIAI